MNVFDYQREQHQEVKDLGELLVAMLPAAAISTLDNLKPDYVAFQARVNVFDAYARKTLDQARSKDQTELVHSDLAKVAIKYHLPKRAIAHAELSKNTLTMSMVKSRLYFPNQQPGPSLFAAEENFDDGIDAVHRGDYSSAVKYFSAGRFDTLEKAAKILQANKEGTDEEFEIDLAAAFGSN